MVLQTKNAPLPLKALICADDAIVAEDLREGIAAFAERSQIRITTGVEELRRICATRDFLPDTVFMDVAEMPADFDELRRALEHGGVRFVRIGAPPPGAGWFALQKPFSDAMLQTVVKAVADSREPFAPPPGRF